MIFSKPRSGPGSVIIRFVIDDFRSFRVSFVEFEQLVFMSLRFGESLGYLGLLVGKMLLLLLLLLQKDGVADVR